ncbi:MAG: ATP-binding protein [Candidatus Heimdallarchaeaceae archaeon]
MVEKSTLISYLEKQISTAPDRLYANTIDQNGKKLFDRFISVRVKKFLSDFQKGKNIENRWITIPGFRGTGKTTLLSQLYHMLLEQGVARDRVLYLSLEEITKLLQSNLYEMIEIYETIRGESIESIKDKIFLFIDEAHYDKNWDTTLKTIFDRSKNIFIIVTGSSALALQTSADSARRMQIEKLFPLTFIEYMKLKNRIMPEKNLKSEIESAVFESKSADEVYKKINPLQKKAVKYWSNIEPFEIEKYLTIGTLPFSIGLSNEDQIYQRVVNILEKVIYEDISKIDSYDKNTLDKIWNLLIILSDTDRISLESLAKKIDLEKPTVFKILGTLSKSELIFPVKAYGTASKQTTKSPKYPFTAPAIKASLLWKIGKLSPTADIYGKLLQDVVALYLYKLSNITSHFNIYYDSGKRCADFIVSDARDGSSISIEVSYGVNKDAEQAKATMDKISAKYGIVISKRELKIEDNVVFIPHKLFFLT